MSQHEPTKAYPYQPGSDGKHIFGVAGPGAEWLREARFATREDAEYVADRINLARRGLLKTLGVTNAELG